METFVESIFKASDDLNGVQMAARAITIFFAAFILIRISGRRSFGFSAPLDNIITITLGAVLSRGIVGASPMDAVLSAGLAIALLHRLLGWLVSRSPRFANVVEGRKIVLFSSGKFHNENLTTALVNKEDIEQALRKELNTDEMTQVKEIFMECTGEISVLKKGK